MYLDEGRVLGEDGGFFGVVVMIDVKGEVGRDDDEVEDGGNLEGKVSDYDVGVGVNGFVVWGGDGGKGIVKCLED